jgi:hypothetical protein
MAFSVDLSGRTTTMVVDYVENLSQIWAVAPALVKLALRDDPRSQNDKEPQWKRIVEEPSSAN